MLLGLAHALAASVAVLPLDGRGVDALAARDATDALRDAIVADGRVDAPTLTALADALTAGHENDLRKARERYAAGRKAWEAGDTALAIPALTEALRLHALAGSEWARRAEEADAHWILAQCFLREGRVLEGRAALERVGALWPGYARTRGTAGPVPTKMLAEVEVGLARQAWAPPEGTAVDELFRALRADWLVVGVVDATGLVRLRGFGGSGEEFEISDRVGVPVDPTEGAWSAMAGAVAGYATGTTPSLGAAVAVGTHVETDVDDERSLGHDDEVDDPDDDGDAPGVVVSTGASSSTTTRTSSRPVRIKETGTVRYDDRPVTSRWWFWTLTLGAVGGTTAAVVALSQPPDVVTVQDEDQWSVAIVSPSD